MKKNIKFISLFIAISSCFIMCEKSPNSNSDMQTFTPLNDAIEIKDLESYTKEVKFIEIEQSEKSLLSDIGNIVIGKDGKLFISSRNAALIALNEDGTLYQTVASKGRGPGEYGNIYDLCISSDGDELMVLDAKKVICYNIKEPSRYRYIKFPTENPIDAIAPASDGGVYIFSASPSNPSDNTNENVNMLSRVDKDGNLLEEYITKDDFTLSIENITQVSDNRYYLRPQNNKHIVYELKPDGIVPTYKIDFQEQTIPDRYYYNVAGEDIRTYMTSSYYKLPMYYQETDNCLFFKAPNRDSEMNCLYSTDNGKGVKWFSSRADPYINIIASDDEYLYTTIYSHDIDKYNEQNPDLHSPIFKLIAKEFIKQNIKNDNENPIIVKLKFNLK